jgi:hypothetical protein
VSDVSFRGASTQGQPGDLSNRVRFRTADGDVPFSALSVGYRTMAGWVVELVARLHRHYRDSANPMAEPCIVLVDEIDLHMHPAWQQQIVGWLRERFPQAQFIVTAHSPLIVQSAEGSERGRAAAVGRRVPRGDRRRPRLRVRVAGRSDPHERAVRPPVGAAAVV